MAAKNARRRVGARLALSLCCSFACAGKADNFVSLFTGRVTVETSNGVVVGKGDSQCHTFLGIPYAMPPVGDLRFKPPEPAPPWGDRLEAFEFGAECMQGDKFSTDPVANMSEDCLFLNIWTPAGASSGSYYPVMVWIYGGGFQQGASSHAEYGGANLAQRGVVVVSLNYRLGALGFMVSVDDAMWGNFGLQDQRLALEWIHQNIGAFGGDPGLVTLWGESAGAMSAGLHMQMDGAGQLFHSVIMQSNPSGYRYRSITVANFLGQAVKRGLDCTDLKCMQEEPAEEIIRIQEGLMGLPRSVGDFFTWGPVITDSFHRHLMRRHAINYAVPFMNVSQPMHALSEPVQDGLALPVLLGFNRHEGQMFVHSAFPVSMHKYVYWAFVGALFKDSARQILKLYGPMADAHREDGDYRPVMSQIIHDYLFNCPNRRIAHLLQQRSHAPVYVYEFAHPTRTPGLRACDGLACHTSELPFVFEQLDVISANYSYVTRAQDSVDADAHGTALGGGWKRLLGKEEENADSFVSHAMAAYWTEFAKHGNPNHPRGPVTWPEWRALKRWRETAPPSPGNGSLMTDKVIKAPPELPEYILIREDMEARFAPDNCVCQFWDRLHWRY